jgi:hypothetical protein
MTIFNIPAFPLNLAGAVIDREGLDRIDPPKYP